MLALLRNPKYCIYGAASQKACSSTTSLETAFNSASVKERSKFEQETLVNVGGSSARRSTYRPSSSSGKPDELIVVTMLVATGCKANIPDKINSLADLKQALEALGGLPQDQVLGVELLWTPQVRAQCWDGCMCRPACSRVCLRKGVCSRVRVSQLPRHGKCQMHGFSVAFVLRAIESSWRKLFVPQLVMLWWASVLAMTDLLASFRCLAG